MLAPNPAATVVNCEPTPVLPHGRPKKHGTTPSQKHNEHPKKGPTDLDDLRGKYVEGTSDNKKMRRDDKGCPYIYLLTDLYGHLSIRPLLPLF